MAANKYSLFLVKSKKKKKKNGEMKEGNIYLSIYLSIYLLWYLNKLVVK